MRSYLILLLPVSVKINQDKFVKIRKKLKSRFEKPYSRSLESNTSLPLDPPVHIRRKVYILPEAIYIRTVVNQIAHFAFRRLSRPPHHIGHQNLYKAGRLLSNTVRDF